MTMSASAIPLPSTLPGRVSQVADEPPHSTHRCIGSKEIIYYYSGLNLMHDQPIIIIIVLMWESFEFEPTVKFSL